MLRPLRVGRSVVHLAAVLTTAGVCACDAAFEPEPERCIGFCPIEGGAPEGSPVARHGALRVVGSRLLDAHGEPVQLRGVSSMWLNWETDGYAASEAGLRWLRDNWNVSVVRAAMGVEPEGAYLSSPTRAKTEVQRVVENAVALGLYVIVDWHDHHAHEHQAEAEAFFAELAEIHGRHPNVIYETFNEPMLIDWSSVLRPYHEAVVAVIRERDPDNVVVLGTPQWSQRVQDAAADPVSADNCMYALHFYACSHGETIRASAREALEGGLPVFATEWGATEADGGVENPRVCEDEAAAWLDLLRDHGVSWAAWKLDGCREASCLFTPGTPVSGPFHDERLNGHASFVRERLLE